MTGTVCDDRTGADPVAAATALLTTTGACVLPPSDVTRGLRAGGDVWPQFARHWDHLVPDPYAAELGVTRLRRYGHYVWRDGQLHPMPNGTFVQPEDSNPLYIDRNRDFEPLTEAFADDPVLRGVVTLLARVAQALKALDDAAEWTVKVHPFRVEAVAGGSGKPTPEGLHRDGVTLVSSLLIARRNAVGGQSAVYDPDGRELLRTTLAEPGTLQLGDDRRVLHSVSPIRPIDGSRPARRDVLVITFAAR